MLVLHFQETLCALQFFLGQLSEKVTHTLQSHIVMVEIVRTEADARLPQTQVDQAVDRGLHLGGKILRDLGAQGARQLKLSSTNDAVWSWRQKMVLKVTTGKEVGKW